jgi:uncharacterized protein YcbX
MDRAPATLPFTIASLHAYPVKSCGGITLDEMLVTETGFEFDRAWMLVDADGEFLSQRELPRLALVRCELRHSELVLRAPGMLALHLRLDTVEQAVRVRVWGDEVAAFDMGDLAAQWFGNFLGQPLRLVRFDPEHRRLADPAWTGDIAAETAFSDGFPLLVISQASLDALNARLAARGVPAMPMARFRPNLVLTGLEAHGEDFLDELNLQTTDGPVRLRLVKPCPRCPMPNIDPETGVSGHEPGNTLAAYRTDPRVNGAVSFGMNAVVVQGLECRLRAGMTGLASLKF